MSTVKITKDGFEKLKKELEYLKTTKRKEVVENIRVALSFGDLSENSEYDEAKTEQGKVENRIHELEELIKTAVLVNEDEISTDAVGVGSKVSVKNVLTGAELEYHVVGSTEANPLQRKISDKSPIGSAIVGAAVGDVVTVATPSGENQLEILKISK
ncbi:MAG: transcription elongation factor GreA [Oscillospiraceae bacterium]|nr:transcription elongation factor GreA [Oscillospiraceae bacterium]